MSLASAARERPHDRLEPADLRQVLLRQSAQQPVAEPRHRHARLPAVSGILHAGHVPGSLRTVDQLACRVVPQHQILCDLADRGRAAPSPDCQHQLMLHRRQSGLASRPLAPTKKRPQLPSELSEPRVVRLRCRRCSTQALRFLLAHRRLHSQTTLPVGCGLASRATPDCRLEHRARPKKIVAREYAYREAHG